MCKDRELNRQEDDGNNGEDDSEDWDESVGVRDRESLTRPGESTSTSSTSGQSVDHDGYLGECDDQVFLNIQRQIYLLYMYILFNASRLYACIVRFLNYLLTIIHSLVYFIYHFKVKCDFYGSWKMAYIE